VSAKAADEAAMPEYVHAVDTEFDFVRRALRRHGVPMADCEDLAQEVFLVTWRRWRDYDPRRPLRAWLTGIAFRVAREHRRTLRRQARPTLDSEPPEEAPTPEHEIASAHARALVLRALETLPAAQRELLVLHELDGRSVREIARGASLPIFTVYTRLRRARLRFARAVERLRGDRRPRRALIPWLVGALATGLALVLVIAGRPGPVTRAPADLLRPTGYWSFDEAPAGGVVHDRSGNGADCRLHDFDPQAQPVAGARGAALGLLPQGWLSCPQPRLDSRRPELTVAAWVRKAEGRRAVTSLVTRQVGAARTFTLGFQDDRVFVRSAPWRIDLSAPLPAHGRWVHVAFIRQGAGSKLYLDGVEVAASSAGLAVPGPLDGELTVGAARFEHEPLVRQRLDGAIDELYTFGRALPPAEIAGLAAR
jgi:RNA polymerase sigma-70 factor (ECF subfamily)